MIQQIALFFAAVWLGGPSSAAAGELYTPPLYSTYGGDCHLANLNDHPIDVTIDVINLSGEIQNTHSDTVVPGGISTGPVVVTPTSRAYCRFTFEGSAKKVRASFIEVGPSPDFYLTAIVPAQ